MGRLRPGPGRPDDAPPGALPAARLTGGRIRGEGTPPPLVLLASGVVAVGLLALPLVGLLTRVSWSTPRNRPDVVGGSGRPPPLPGLFAVGDGTLPACSACRWPGCWHARSSAASRSSGRSPSLPLVLPPVVGGVALLLAFGRDGILGRPLFDWFGIQFTFSHGGCRARRDLRGHAVPDRHGGGRPAGDGRPFRGGGGVTRSRPMGDVPPGDRADDLVVVDRGSGAHLGRGPSASSGPRSPSPVTSRGVRRPFPSPSTWRWRATSGSPWRCHCCCCVVSFAVLVALRGRWLGAVRR